MLNVCRRATRGFLREMLGLELSPNAPMRVRSRLFFPTGDATAETLSASGLFQALRGALAAARHIGELTHTTTENLHLPSVFASQMGSAEYRRLRHRQRLAETVEAQGHPQVP
jgi:hypothetical protein